MNDHHICSCIHPDHGRPAFNQPIQHEPVSDTSRRYPVHCGYAVSITMTNLTTAVAFPFCLVPWWDDCLSLWYLYFCMWLNIGSFDHLLWFSLGEVVFRLSLDCPLSSSDAHRTCPSMLAAVSIAAHLEVRHLRRLSLAVLWCAGHLVSCPITPIAPRLLNPCTHRFSSLCFFRENLFLPLHWLSWASRTVGAVSKWRPRTYSASYPSPHRSCCLVRMQPIIDLTILP